MSPSTWIRKNSGVTTAVVVFLSSLVISNGIPAEGVAILGDESVVQLLGVILAGQLAVIALTVPAALELRGDVLDSDLTDDLSVDLDDLLAELKSDTFWTLVLLLVVFSLSVAAESHPDLLVARLPLGLMAGNAFVAIKISAIALSALAMWDSVEPLFGIGVAMTELKAVRRSPSGESQAGDGSRAHTPRHGRHLTQ